MADKGDSSLVFFNRATAKQWSYVLDLYKDVLKLKAQQTRSSRKNGPQELIKIDTWYQEQLPKIINSRKERHILHEELVQIMKWKLMRGKNRPRLLDLVKINTELAVLQTSKKAFKKLPNVSGAITALTNLKGIGPASASAILTAAAPEYCAYMADESMLATPGVEATDYTLAEYLNYSEQIKTCVDRLSELDPESKWNPHKVELALWTHYLTRQMKPSLLDQMPLPDGTIPKIEKPIGENDESNDVSNGVENIINEDSNISAGTASDEKSNDSTLQDNTTTSTTTKMENNNGDNNGEQVAPQLPVVVASNGNGDKEIHPGNGVVSTGVDEVNDNASSVNNDDLDSKDALGLSSEENSRNVVINEEFSNLSNSNLSADDLTSGGDTNTNDSLTNDGPKLKKLRAE